LGKIVPFRYYFGCVLILVEIPEKCIKKQAKFL
jgi:hypothetical protein